MSSGPYQPITDKFNPSLMLSDNDYLTLAQADNRYLRIGGALYTSDIFASGAINGSTISATSISGTLTTASQPNITSFGMLTALSMNGILNNSSTIDSTSTSTGSIITSGGMGIAKNLYVGTGIYGTLQTASQPNITSVGTLSQLDFSNSGCNAVIRPTSSYLYMGTSSNSDLDFLIERHGVFVARFSPLGLKLSSSAVASYPLDVVGDISSTGSWRNGSTVLMNSSGVLQTAGQTNITSVGTLSSLAVSGSSTLAGVAINGGVSSTQGWIDSTSAIRVQGNTTVPTYGNGIGLGFNSFTSTGSLSAHNHTLGTHNRITINDNTIYITGTSDSPSDAVAFGTNNLSAMGKWTFHQSSNTGNRLRIAYSDTVASDQYCTSAGIHTFTNQLSAPSYGVSGSALLFNDSLNVSGSSILSSVEHLALSYSQANHAGNISAVDTSQNQMNINIGDRVRISAYNASIPYSIGFGGFPAGSALPDAFVFYQASSASTKMRIAYDTGSNYSQIWCGSDSKLNISTETTCKGLNAGITNVPISAVLNIGGDGAKVDVGTNSSKILEFHGTNATPTVGYLLMSNDSGNTATNAMTFGTYSTTNINFYTHNTHVMTVAQGKVGVGYGNTNPTYPLDVAGYVNWSSGGGTAYWLKANIAGGLQSGSSVSFNVSLKVSDNILCSDSVINYSDRRLKKNIQNIDMSFDTYYNHCIPKQYDRIDRDDQHQIGFIAQDMMKSCPILVSGIKNKEMKKQSEDDPDDNCQLAFDYARMSVVNCMMIRKLIKQNQDLIKRIEQLELSTK